MDLRISSSERPLHFANRADVSGSQSSALLYLSGNSKAHRRLAISTQVPRRCIGYTQVPMYNVQTAASGQWLWHFHATANLSSFTQVSVFHSERQPRDVLDFKGSSNNLEG